MAKGKKTGGRQKGTKNKVMSSARELAERMGVDPLEILLNFASDNWEALGYESAVYHSEGPEGETKMGYVIKPEMRVTAAKEAAKYIYPTQKSVEHSGDGHNQIKLIVEDYTKKS